MDELLKRITIDPARCGGKPCIRGMRIRVIDVLEMLASGMNFQEVLAQHPDLEHDDVRASLVYAVRQADRPGH